MAFSEVLKTNTSLTSLNIMSEEKKGNTEEKENKMIIDGWLTGNGIGDEGAKAISEMLKMNTALTHLDLQSENEGTWNEKK